MTSTTPRSEPIELAPAHPDSGEDSTVLVPELLEFNVDVTEAAQVLGVSRTRLSQLTSKGVFSFERRKIDARNRLFYSRHELLQHLNGQRVRISGATAAPAQFQWSPSAAPQSAQIHSQNISHNEIEITPQVSQPHFASVQMRQRKTLLNLHSAVELSNQDTTIENLNGLKQSLGALQQQQLDLQADMAKQWNAFSELKKNLRQATQETAKNRAAQFENSLSSLQIQHETEILIQALCSVAQTVSNDNTGVPAVGPRRTCRRNRACKSQKVQLFR